MSRHLTARSIDHVVLERGEVANSWRTQRWDSLRLLTPNWMTRLPGWAYDGDDPDGYLTAPEVADLVAGVRRGVGRPGGHRHHGDVGPARRDGVRGGHRPRPVARADRRPGGRAPPAASCPADRPAAARGDRLGPRARTTATLASCPTAACWSSARRRAACRSPTSSSAPAGRSPSPSASTSGCLAPTGATTSSGGWTRSASWTSGGTRWTTSSAPVTCRRCSSSGGARTLDLNALQAGRRPAGRPVRRRPRRPAPSSPAPWPTSARWPTSSSDACSTPSTPTPAGGASVPSRPTVPAPPLGTSPALRRDPLGRLGDRRPAGLLVAGRARVRPPRPAAARRRRHPLARPLRARPAHAAAPALDLHRRRRADAEDLADHLRHRTRRSHRREAS